MGGCVRRLLSGCLLTLACGTSPGGPDGGSGSAIDRATDLVGAWTGTLHEVLLTQSGPSPYYDGQTGMLITSTAPNSVTVYGPYDEEHSTQVNGDGSFALFGSTQVGGVFCPHGVALQGSATLRNGVLGVTLSGPVERESFFDVECPPIDARFAVTATLQRLPDLVVPHGLQVEELEEGVVVLRWDPTHIPSEPSVELNVAGGEWRGTEAWDLADGYARIMLSEYQPELSLLGFRVRLVRGRQQSDFAEPVYWRRPLSMPIWMSISAHPLGQEVSWQGTSALATQAILDRGFPEQPDGGVAWENVGTSAQLSGSAVVSGLLEDRLYWYRVTYAFGEERSHSLVTQSDHPTSLDAPRDVHANVVSGRQVSLSWTNVTQRGTDLLVWRDVEVLTTLPADAGAYTDTAPYSGEFTYQLQVRGGASGYNSGSSYIKVTVP